ncbi:MAG: hypothetical protein P8046_00855 [Anaerolineales bacterium]
MEDGNMNKEEQPEEPIESQPGEAEPTPESPTAEPIEPRPETPPETESPGLSAIPEPMDEVLPETEQQKEPTKFQLFLRKALIWLGVGAVVFLAGFATFYFALYQPKVNTLDQTQAQLTQAQSDIQDLETQLADAQSQVDNLNEEVSHRALLSVMVDIYAARLALVQEDSVSAKAALSTTSATLSEITDVIAGFDSGLADTLPNRLSLIITNIDRDPETAIADCDQILKDLGQAEMALFQ